MPCCCVPLCKSGYSKSVEAIKASGEKGPSFFKIKQDQLQAFNRAIPRQDRELTTKDYVCSEHFYESDISWYHDDLLIGGKTIKGERRKNPILKKDAMPRIFKGPAYFSKPEIKRRAPKERSKEAPTNKRANKGESIEQNGSLKATESPYVSDRNERDVDISEKAPEKPHLETFIDPSGVKMPAGWGVHKYKEVHFYVRVDRQGSTTHIIEIFEGTQIKIRVGGRLVHIKEGPTEVRHCSDIEILMFEVAKLIPCEGLGYGAFSKTCKGGIKKGIRCKACRGSRRKERKKEATNSKRMLLARKRSKLLHKIKKRSALLLSKVKTLKKQLNDAYKECRKLDRAQVQKAIKDLPEPQQHAIMACLQAAKRKGPKGNRFQADWIYESLLMSIKSSALYEHIRRHKILSLPCRATLNRYIRNLRPAYGYQPTLFQVLKEKLYSWDEKEKHGSILLDEIKLDPDVSFDRHTLKTTGFVDLGKHTQPHQQGQLGDHALEVLFQPFRGKWVQSLGCFLSKGNAKGDVLAKLILEGIALAESSGLMVDAIVTDGATWNRNMWAQFGVGEEASSCEHPVDPDRKLWFLSDWCHLIKCPRNILSPIVPKETPRKTTNTTDDEVPEELEPTAAATATEVLKKKRIAALNKEIYIPEGTVQRKHWIALLREEQNMAKRYGAAALTYVPNFSKKHIFPTGFERMNVKLAYQFFSNSVAAGMEWYGKKGVEDHEDSDATQAFIRRINNLADVMNSNGPAGALRKHSEKEEVIKDYLEYHKQCVQMAKTRGLKSFFSESTDLGLLVTLRSTLQLSNYLIDDVGFEYVMTARFNQDAIEQFFASIRSAAGPNTHPNPRLFAQLHRLFSVYSLIQPPKGSNTSGVDNMRVLVSVQDEIAAAEKNRKDMINDILDEVITQGEAFQSLPLAHQADHVYLPRPPQMEDSLVKFMAGFTASRQKAICKDCVDCLLTLTQFREEAGPSHDFTKIKEMYGGYSYASEELAALIKAVETAVQESLHNHDVHENMYVTTLQYLKLNPKDLVACIKHKEDISKRIVHFYLTMRMFFAADRKNEEMEAVKRLKKKYSKQSKLQ